MSDEIKSHKELDEQIPLLPLEDFDDESGLEPGFAARIAAEINELSPEIEANYHITEAIKALRRMKSDERTPRDRFISICITEAEKLYAIFATYLLTQKEISLVSMAQSLMFGVDNEDSDV